MSDKSFSIRSNAVRNARGQLGKAAKQGVHFTVIKDADTNKFSWVPVEGTPAVEVAETVAPEATTVVAVTPAVKVIKAKVRARVAKKAPKVRRKAGRKSITSVAAVSGKRRRMFRLIASPKGASLDTLVKALGWQKHTVRGAVSTIASQFKVKIKSFRDERRGRVYQVA
jgi:hypothetical protein